MSDINIQTFSGKVSVKNDLRVGQGHLFVDTAANQVGLNSLTPQANLHVTGNTYVTSDLRVGSKVVIDSSAADSNVLVITGGGIKADFILGDGRSQWTTTGNDVYYTGGVAIGSSQTPTTALDVTGSGTFSGDLTAAFLHGDGSNISNITSSQWTTVNMNELYYTLGNVGIGNQNPNYTLDVTGDINFTGDLYQNGTIFSGGGGGGGSGFWQAGTGTKIYYSAGEVGIANTNPQHTLSVGSNLYVEDAGSNVLVVDGNVACTQLTLGQFEIVPSYGLGDVTAESNVTTDTVELNNATTGLSTVSNVVVGGELTVSGNAAVSSNLTVSGNVTVSKDVTVTEDLTVSGNVTVGTADLFVDTVNSRVGIGTDNPTGGLLHVNGAVYSTSLVSEGTTDSVLTIRNTSTPAIIRTLATGGQTYIQSGTLATSDSRADINFTSMYDGTNFMKIQGSSGNVGIGSTIPEGKLTVTGTNNTYGPIFQINDWKTLTWSGNTVVGNKDVTIITHDGSQSGVGVIGGIVEVICHRGGYGQQRAYARFHLNYSFWDGAFRGHYLVLEKDMNAQTTDIDIILGNSSPYKIDVRITSPSGTLGQYYIKFHGPIYNQS